MYKHLHFISIVCLPWVTNGVGETIVSLDEVTIDEKLVVRSVILVRERDVLIVVSV